MHLDPLKGLQVHPTGDWLARHVPRIFFVIALTFGLTYSCVSPPFQVPDEIAHFGRAYGISTGHCIGEAPTPIPQGIADLYSAFPAPLDYKPGNRKWITRQDLSPWLKQASVRRTAPLTNVAANLYTCAPYLPSAAFLDLARVVNLPPLAMLDVGRIVNLIVYVLLTYTALRVLPDFHLQLMLLALMPMALTQASSFSADALSMASTFFFLAYVLKLAFDDGVTVLRRAEWLILSSAVVCFSLMKFNLWLVLAIALIPQRKLPRWCKPWLLVSIMIAFAVGPALIWELINSSNVHKFIDSKMTLGIDVNANAAFIRHHPGVFLEDVVRGVSLYTTGYLIMFVGRFSHLTLPLPFPIVAVYIACLLIIAVTQRQSVSLSLWHRGLLLFIFSASLVSVFALLFNFETPKTYISQIPPVIASVNGIQGRYFIPFALPLLLVFPVRKFRIPGRLALGLTLATICSVNAFSVNLIWKTYYEHARSMKHRYDIAALKDLEGRGVMAEDGRLFLIQDQQVHYVPDQKTLSALANARPTTLIDVSAFPEGAPLPALPANVVREGTDDKIFVISEGKRHEILDPEIAEELNHRAHPPQVSKDVLSRFPAGTAMSGDVLAVPGYAFLIQGGKRRHIPDPQTLESMGLTGQVLFVDDSILNLFPLGPELPHLARPVQDVH